MPRFTRRKPLPLGVLFHVERVNTPDALARLSERYDFGPPHLRPWQFWAETRRVRGIEGTTVSRSASAGVASYPDRCITWKPEPGLPGVWQGVRNGRSLPARVPLQEQCDRAAADMRAACAAFAESVSRIEARHAEATRLTDAMMEWTPEGRSTSIGEDLRRLIAIEDYDAIRRDLAELAAGAWRDRAAMVHGSLRIEYEEALTAARRCRATLENAGSLKGEITIGTGDGTTARESVARARRDLFDLAAGLRHDRDQMNLGTMRIEYLEGFTLTQQQMREPTESEAWLRSVARGPLLSPLAKYPEAWMRAADSPGLAESTWHTEDAPHALTFREFLALHASGNAGLDGADTHRLRMKAGRGGTLRGAPEATLGAFAVGLTRTLDTLASAPTRRNVHMPTRADIAARLIEFKGRELLNRGGQITPQAITHSMRRATAPSAAATAPRAEIAAIVARIDAVLARIADLLLHA